MRANDLMTEAPATATEQTSVAEALALLYELDVRHLPVVRGEELVGIVSDRDLRGYMAPSDEDALDSIEKARTSTIGAVMNASPVRVHPETSALELVDAMLFHRIGAIPVTDMDTGALLGIVSYVDLLTLFRETLDAD
ncbi:MAG: CBS domain-containing protein [Myxococcota bacterium]